MRKAINENPKVQIAVVGALLVVFGFFLMTKVMKKDAKPAAVPANAPIGSETTAGASGSPTAGATPVSSSPSGAVPTPSSAPATPTGSAGTVSPEALVPGPGLPREVKAAWDRGDAIVLLIVRGGATDDRLVRGSVERLSSPGISVFVARARQIARYSRITQGVGVSRVPALVVVRPRRVSGSVPRAQVSYGFRNAGSVVQAVQDALYTGRDDLPYSPR